MKKRTFDDAAICKDRKAGMSWNALCKKYKMGLDTVAKVLRRGGVLPPLPPKVKKPPKFKPIVRKAHRKLVDDLQKVNRALAHAANKPADRWFVGHNHKGSTFSNLEACKTKAEALAVCLDQHSRGKTVKLLKEVPFKLTIVLDE